jgi:hypothetical protein
MPFTRSEQTPHQNTQQTNHHHHSTQRACHHHHNREFRITTNLHSESLAPFKYNEQATASTETQRNSPFKYNEQATADRRACIKYLPFRLIFATKLWLPRLLLLAAEVPPVVPLVVNRRTRIFSVALLPVVLPLLLVERIANSTFLTSRRVPCLCLNARRKNLAGVAVLIVLAVCFQNWADVAPPNKKSKHDCKFRFH